MRFRHIVCASLLTGLLVTPAYAQAASAPARPPHYWRSAGQAIAIANRQPSVRSLRRVARDVEVRASTPTLGLWEVSYSAPGRSRLDVLVEDRTGDVLEQSRWAYPFVSKRLSPFDRNVEIASAALAAVLLLVFFDFRRPLRLANLDLVVLLSFGASLWFWDRGDPLVSVPLVYPPLLYMLARLLVAGVRPGGAPGPLARLGELPLGALLFALVAARVAFNLTLGTVGDVGYASVLGANGIHHGWPLYSPGPGHLDTYGPITYLAYLPFELVFPMGSSWQHDFLPAAHAATIAFDLLTLLGVFLLGRRFASRRLGLSLAVAWAACPLTFIPFASNTNDGLVAMLVVYALLALASPARRGALLGLAAAAKFAPLALAGALAAGGGKRRIRPLTIFATALAGVCVASIWLFLPAGGLGLFWDKTLGFQLDRHSLLSLWGEHPELSDLRSALELAVAGVAAAAFFAPGRRSAAQVAALCGATLIALELTMTQWSYFYVSWFMPLLLVALLTPAGEPAVADEPLQDFDQKTRQLWLPRRLPTVRVPTARACAGGG